MESRGVDRQLEHELAARVGAGSAQTSGFRAGSTARNTRGVPRIIGFTRQAEALRHTDDAVAAAWEDRMAGRRVAHHEIVERLADEGELADGWDIDSGALLFYTVTLPRLWDELVVEQGWTIEKYREHVTRLLVRGFLADP